MQIMNTFVAKIGPAGKRNRAARRRAERRQGSSAVAVAVSQVSAPVSAATETLVKFEVVPTPLDFSVAWDETLARNALETFAKSGMSQRAFAAEHSFPESRLRSWKKKLETISA